MIKIKKNTNYFIFVFSLLLTSFLYSQKNKNCDNIVNVASNEIYSNPDKVIKIGESIVNESGNNVDSKIKGYKLICDAYTSKRNYEKTLEYLNFYHSLFLESSRKYSILQVDQEIKRVNTFFEKNKLFILV